MRTRRHDFFDSKGLRPLYGFQVFSDGQWMNAAQDGEPCLFDTSEERDLKQAEFRKMNVTSNSN